MTSSPSQRMAWKTHPVQCPHRHLHTHTPSQTSTGTWTSPQLSHCKSCLKKVYPWWLKRRQTTTSLNNAVTNTTSPTIKATHGASVFRSTPCFVYSWYLQTFRNEILLVHHIRWANPRQSHVCNKNSLYFARQNRANMVVTFLQKNVDTPLNETNAFLIRLRNKPYVSGCRVAYFRTRGNYSSRN